MPSDQRNSIMANTHLRVFPCLTSLWLERYLLACCSTYNTFLMDLPVPYLVFHSSFLTAKSQFSGCTWWLPLCNKKFLHFSYWLLWLHSCFSNTSRFIQGSNGLKQQSIMATLLFQMIIDMLRCSLDAVCVGSQVIMISKKKLTN